MKMTVGSVAKNSEKLIPKTTDLNKRHVWIKLLYKDSWKFVLECYQHLFFVIDIIVCVLCGGLRLTSHIVGGRAYVFLCFHSSFMQKFHF